MKNNGLLRSDILYYESRDGIHNSDLEYMFTKKPPQKTTYTHTRMLTMLKCLTSKKLCNFAEVLKRNWSIPLWFN